MAITLLDFVKKYEISNWLLYSVLAENALDSPF